MISSRVGKPPILWPRRSKYVRSKTAMLCSLHDLLDLGRELRALVQDLVAPAAVLRGEAPDLVEVERATEVVLALDVDLREVAAPIAPEVAAGVVGRRESNVRKLVRPRRLSTHDPAGQRLEQRAV